MPDDRDVHDILYVYIPNRPMGSNPAGALVSVSWECCVLSGRGLCVGLIAGLEECY
jgi:hypothetical protein